MIIPQERIESFSASFNDLLAQLNELSRLQGRIKQAQAAALKSVKRRSGSPRMIGRHLPRRKPTA
jgi:hypothetical protein